MTTKQSRPAGELGGRESVAATQILAEHAHLFGVGVSELERRAVLRRGLASLAECWPQLVEQITRRAVQQALAEALPTYWLTRAERLEQVGTTWADGAALNCRRKAWILATYGPSPDLVDEVDEVLDLAKGVA